MTTTALSTISELPSGKAEVERFKGLLKSEILANNEDPLKILVRLKYIEKTIADTLSDKDIEDHLLREFDLYGKEKVVEVMGAKLNTQEVGVKYDYDGSGDPVWMDLDKAAKEIAEKKKAREKFLQALPQEGTVDPGTGVYINRPPKTSKTKVIVKMY
jgi:hypothetical protein